MANESGPMRPSGHVMQELAVDAVAVFALAEAAGRQPRAGFGTRPAVAAILALALTGCPGGNASTNGSNVLAAGIGRAEAQEGDGKKPVAKPDEKKSAEAEKEPEEWKYPPVIEWEVEVEVMGIKIVVTLSRTGDAKGTVCVLKSDDPTVPKGSFELKRPDGKELKFPGVRSPENEEKAKAIAMAGVFQNKLNKETLNRMQKEGELTTKGVKTKIPEFEMRVIETKATIKGKTTVRIFAIGGKKLIVRDDQSQDEYPIDAELPSNEAEVDRICIIENRAIAPSIGREPTEEQARTILEGERLLGRMAFVVKKEWGGTDKR